MSEEITTHPIQVHYTPREQSVVPQVVTLRAYEVYRQLRGQQERLITGDCRGGFGAGAERQTVRVDKVNDRVAIRMRQLRDGTITRDVMVDGYVYTPAISENWLAGNLSKIIEIVSGKSTEMHLGMGQWERI